MKSAFCQKETTEKGANTKKPTINTNMRFCRQPERGGRMNLFHFGFSFLGFYICRFSVLFRHAISQHINCSLFLLHFIHNHQLKSKFFWRAKGKSVHAHTVWNLRKCYKMSSVGFFHPFCLRWDAAPLQKFLLSVSRNCYAKLPHKRIPLIQFTFKIDRRVFKTFEAYIIGFEREVCIVDAFSLSLPLTVLSKSK